MTRSDFCARFLARVGAIFGERAQIVLAPKMTQTNAGENSPENVTQLPVPDKRRRNSPVNATQLLVQNPKKPTFMSCSGVQRHLVD
jgi:hypothetical protein